MECYGLPYGGLGFASHILTYYTIIALAFARSPLRPWKKLTHSRLDLWLSMIGLMGSTSVAVFTLVRCRNDWRLLVIGIWKLGMSFFSAIVGVHVAFIVKRSRAPYRLVNAADEDEKNSKEDTGPVIGWIALCE